MCNYDYEDTIKDDNSGKHYCVFCGKEIIGYWEEYDKYYECSCQDAKNKRNMIREIDTIISQFPKPKYRAKQTKKFVMVKKEK